MTSETARPGIKSALWLPIFDGLADPIVVAQLAADAEAAGWDGVFVWDHLRWREPVVDVADPWITLAAIASATERVRIGPMIAPLARRRPVKVAKETATLDHLSRGRLTLGVGIGGDRFGEELSKTGEELDDRRRGEMLDESLAILTSAWTGEPVSHRGEHFTIDAMPLRPRPVQSSGVPIWVGTFPTSRKPRRRAARYDGIFPVNLTEPEQLAEIVADVRSFQDEAGRDPSLPYDVAVELPRDADFDTWRAAGATWWMAGFDCESINLDEVRGVLRDGPVR